MAHSDYIIRGSGLIASTARLLGSITADASEIDLYIGSFRSQSGALPSIGSAVLIDDEIVKLVAVTLDSITVARGCADTIPAAHAVGATIWFFDPLMGYDPHEYLSSETVGVKLLMKTTGGAMEPKNSPPNALTFNSRFARPYPPGNVKVRTLSFAEVQRLETGDPALSLTWDHRNRITQADQLIAHTAASISPEVGTTYRVRVYRATGNVLLRTTAGLTGTSYSYSYGTAVVDFGHDDEDQAGYFLLNSARGAFDSLQTYRIDFVFRSIEGDGFSFGWNRKWSF